MDIELRLLRSFVLMHEAGSISRAAERMGCTQAAMSMRLKTIETELGAALFLRTQQGLDPTPRGAELYAKALGVLAAYDEMMSATRARPMAERIRLGMPDDYALGWLGPVLAKLSLDRAEVEITCDLSAHLMAKVQRQDLDLALVTLDSRPALTRAAAEVPLSWVGAAQGGTVRLAAYPEGCVFRRAMIASLQAAGRPWQVAVQSSSHAGIFAAVRAGVAVSAVATGTAPPDLVEGGAGLPALPRIPVYLVSTAKLRPLARRLEAALMTQMLAWPNR
jgi:DNA-binding transcriptional LysR family regulator